MQGLESKNAQSRSDCCEQINDAVRTMGADFVARRVPRQAGRQPIFKQLALLLSEHTGGVRGSALKALMSVYEQRGAQRLWALAGGEAQLNAVARDSIRSSMKTRDKELAKAGQEAGKVVWLWPSGTCICSMHACWPSSGLASRGIHLNVSDWLL